MLTRTVRGVHDAFSWITVLPLPQPRGEFDRRRAATIMAAVPVVGVVLGIASAAIAFGLSYTQLPSLVIGGIVVVLLALVTRGMHLDGLADTIDGLATYGDAARMQHVMRSGDVGPLGAGTLVMVLLGESLAFGTMVDDERWYAIAFVIFLSRAIVPIVCRRGVQAANGDGFGSLVAGTQRWSIVAWSIICLAAAVALGLTEAAGPGALVRAVVTTALIGIFAWAFSGHCIRRNGGLAGDIIGATMELTTVLAAVALLV